MMEIIRIRKVGYLIRYLFKDFVDRYRIFVSGIGSFYKEDCRVVFNKICFVVFSGGDY